MLYIGPYHVRRILAVTYCVRASPLIKVIWRTCGKIFLAYILGNTHGGYIVKTCIYCQTSLIACAMLQQNV
jgi:hypothetical protein